eukprot:CAMPEP_0181391450 /NCGR_PEP_ID=MMETSP1106-20121128/26046_1 /TAXON_ID=81844 /ORGANISM="Mantoniella antarctica, Strain SL-175" /LENGTH=215 /DNA_ID=CAMNT_0023512471 /DNA_START=943 /DNA_END=1588 /DNA_ORIENTATION=-
MKPIGLSSSPPEHGHRVLGKRAEVLSECGDPVTPGRRNAIQPFPAAHPQLLGVDSSAHEDALAPCTPGARDVVLQRVPDRDGLSGTHAGHRHHTLVNHRRRLAHQKHLSPHLPIPARQGAGHGQQAASAHGDDAGLATTRGRCRAAASASMTRMAAREVSVAPAAGVGGIGPPRTVNALSAVCKQEFRLRRCGHRGEPESVKGDGPARTPGKMQT